MTWYQLSYDEETQQPLKTKIGENWGCLQKWSDGVEKMKNILALEHHVAEIFSPPRVALTAEHLELTAGLATEQPMLVRPPRLPAPRRSLLGASEHHGSHWMVCPQAQA